MTSVALVLVPSEAGFYDSAFAQYSTLSLTLGVLQSHLRSAGHDVSSTDLNAGVPELLAQFEAKRWLPVLDADTVLAALGGHADSGLEDMLDFMLDTAGCGSAEVIGISTGSQMSLFELHLAFLLGARIQSRYCARLIFGGANLNYLWEFRWAFGDLWRTVLARFPYLITGPGGDALEAICASADEAGASEVYRTLPGAVYHLGSEIVRNAEAPQSTACPDFEGVLSRRHTLSWSASPGAPSSTAQDLEHYYRWPMRHAVAISQAKRRYAPVWTRADRPVVPYSSNHICPHRCAFCVQSRADKPRASVKDAVTVVDDIERLIEQCSSTHFMFLDNAINVSPAFMSSFAEEVAARRLEFDWSDCARFDGLGRRDLEALARSGCRKLIFGLDTASPRLLRSIDKTLDLVHAREVLSWCADLGIGAEVEVILGLPYEDEAAFRETYDFVAEQIAAGTLTMFHLSKYFVVPQSSMGRDPAKYGMRIERLEGGHRELAEASRQIFGYLACGGRAPSAVSARLVAYSELKGRDIGCINMDTEERFGRMVELYGKLEFARRFDEALQVLRPAYAGDHRS